jgi:triacylglycerol lipase
MRSLGRHTRIGTLAALAACAVALVPAAAASAADVSDLLPAVSPPGANDFTCNPTTAHPAPVVLVHGTFEGAADNWATASPKFKAAGYCVFALEYGNRGTGDIAASAGQLQRFVDAVLAATGARQVSMVGHSQGGMMPRYYLKFLGGASKVDDLVGLAPSNHGTDNPGALVAGATFCPRATSSAPARPSSRTSTPATRRRRRLLHADRDALRRGGHPVHVGLPGPRPRTANILLQDACPAEVIDHHEMPNDGLAIRWALQALGQPGPADPAHPPSCT